ncbi:MAG: hypothetical protein RL246_1692 [Bacteroidota bacterium]
MRMRYFYFFYLLPIFFSCTMNQSPKSFGEDVEFLQKHLPDAIVLGAKDSDAQIIVAPSLQGRVMTSTASGRDGASFGWLNYDLIVSGKSSPHMTAYGGEERFWLGPEGGQFSIYFKKGLPFTFANWQVPKEIDTEAFDLVSSTQSEAKFKKSMHFENYSGVALDLMVQRDIKVLSYSQINELLGVEVPAELKTVGFETQNTMTNTGAKAWDQANGMLSIWILSMLNASEKTMVVAPYKEGEGLGPVYTDDYFGKVPADRLRHDKGLIFFKADAKYRSKIGISPKRAMPFICSYDASAGVLTIAQFDIPSGNQPYVNSKWELQKDPFSGDLVNSYNDGLNEGKQLGNFYEIESSSPAAALSPGQSLSHAHRTFHLKGSVDQLNVVTKKILGISVEQIK